MHSNPSLLHHLHEVSDDSFLILSPGLIKSYSILTSLLANSWSWENAMQIPFLKKKAIAKKLSNLICSSYRKLWVYRGPKLE